MSADKYFELRMSPLHLLSGHAGHFFIGGLISFRIFRETNNPLWFQRGEQFKDRINTWNDQGSMWNFENKSFLLHAEKCYSNGNYDMAWVLYENAITSAQQHKFIHEEALAYELAANFYLHINNNPMALKYFTSAHEAYFKWGAFAKVTKLYTSMQEKLGNVLSPADPNTQEASNPITLHIDTPQRNKTS